jgi:hypothetical protein
VKGTDNRKGENEMIEYYSELIRIITASMESLDEDVYNSLVEQCVDTIQRGGKSSPVV